MKILVAGPQYPDSFAKNIAVTLREMGHEVTVRLGTKGAGQRLKLCRLLWSYFLRAFPALENLAHRSLVRTARQVQPDLVLVTYSKIPPQIIRELKNTCPGRVVCWFADPIIELYRFYLIASPFDAWFVKEPFLARSLKDKLGLDAHYLPECCNPIWHRRVPLSPEDRLRYGCDVAAMGNLHYYRARMLEPFQNYDIRVWGNNCPGWLESGVRHHYTNQYVAEQEKAKALLGSKIVINTMKFLEIEAVNCSLFEVAGCGAFQIADWKPALPELFQPESEIVTFRTGGELKEKVDYYLAHPEERHEIADRAYARAHREHTYEIRLKKMFEVLGVQR